MTAVPFDTTTVIPAGWSAHHQGVILGATNARVLLTDPSRTVPGEPDPETGYHGPDTPHVVAGGPQDDRVDWREGIPCRIQALRDDRLVDHAEQGVSIRLYLVQLPADVPDIEAGYEATVLSALNDEHLEGETLAATDVRHGSERFTRDVVFTHNQAPRQEA